jgi:hypothetical protein
MVLAEQTTIVSVMCFLHWFQMPALLAKLPLVPATTPVFWQQIGIDEGNAAAVTNHVRQSHPVSGPDCASVQTSFPDGRTGVLTEGAQAIGRPGSNR